MTDRNITGPATDQDYPYMERSTPSPSFWAAKTAGHARRARFWAWVATVSAVVAVVNAVLVTAGVYR